MAYIEGFVVPVPESARAAYEEHSAKTSALLTACGAQQVVQCWGADVPDGKVTDFYRAVAAKPGEIIVFAWIVWPSKAARDAGIKKAMADPAMRPGAMALPFDSQRMIYGGFDKIFDSMEDA